MKKIIAVFLVLSLLVVSASASGVYEVEDDTELSSVSTYSTYDLTDTEATWLMEIRDYSELIYNIVNWGFDINLDSIWERLGFLMADTQSIVTSVGTTNYWLEQIWSSAPTETTLSLVSNKIGTTNYWLEQLWSSVASEYTLSLISDKVATEDTLSAFKSEAAVYFTVPVGQAFLYPWGDLGETSSPMYLSSLIPWGFAGLSTNLKSLQSFLTASEGWFGLSSDGVAFQLSSDQSITTLISNSILGIRSLIAGSEFDNIYDGSITGNNNEETNFSATGLGPLLNKYLDAIQLDTGRLTYMFASPEDLEAKKRAESTTESFTDNFLDPDSDASIKLSDVGVLKDSSKTVKELGQTGVTPGQAFEQLTGNSSIFSFFTQETANDLDTTVSTYSRDPGTQIVTSYYVDSRAEFFDLIGKGGEE